ncbi:hypothetical protein [Pseudonocardia sp. ICBG1034]|nr:hypothetical protein [Pseudonocardia sp. ICBG1034]
MNVGADRGRPGWYETDAGTVPRARIDDAGHLLQYDAPARPTARLLR